MKFRTLKKKERVQAGDIHCDLLDNFTERSAGDIAEAYCGSVLRPVTKGKWRKMKKSERIQIGDRLTNPEGSQIDVEVDLNMTVRDWLKVKPVGGYVERRVAKKGKKWQTLKNEDILQKGDVITADHVGWKREGLCPIYFGMTVGGWKRGVSFDVKVERPIDRQVTSSKSKWHFVDDKLPKPGITVCVQVADDPDTQVDCLNTCGLWEIESNVIRWRYLPKAPKSNA